MILIGNGPLISRDPGQPFFQNGAVLTDGNRIKAVGNYDELKKRYPDAQFCDAGGMVIMPGLMNAHEHIYSAFSRGGNLPYHMPAGFLEVLEGIWWKLDAALQLEHTYYSAVMVFLECIRNGVTFVNDHHASYGAVRGSLDKIAEAARLLSVRACLCYEVSDRHGAEQRNEAIAENMEFIDAAAYRKDSMLHAMFGLHASFTLSDESLLLCAKENKSGAGYHIHVAESALDEMRCMNEHGMNVVERLEKFGLLNDRSIAVHAANISAAERERLKELDTMVVHNPESNMGNATGTPDTLALLDDGIVTGLGTDGYTQDMLESLKVANILQKHLHQHPGRGFDEASKMLFGQNAAIAKRLTGEDMGILRPGALADIIIMDYRPATPMTAENYGGHVMFGMSGAMTDTTMVDGKIVFRNRKFTQINEEELKLQCQKSAADLWKSLEKNR